MKRASLLLTWMAVMAAAVVLRFDGLADRPMHADEATGARITAQRMEGQGGRFDPTHYHGPLLADLTMPVCRARGETTWRSMSKTTLRLVPALAGCLLVLLPLFARRRLGDGAALLAAALLATSPLLAYYSRMFIHEILLCFFGMAALLLALIRPRWGLWGLMLGLMFAAKESFAISVLAWLAAAVLLLWQERSALAPGWWRVWWRPMLVAGLLALMAALLSYTHGFTHPRGAWDAVRTYFVYQTVGGHDKPWYEYFRLLVLPIRTPGVWWYGTPVVVLAIWGFIRGFAPEASPEFRRITRFLGYSIVGHAVIYSCIAYKTPWLACLPWAQVCVLAGCALGGRPRRSVAMRAALGLLVLCCVVSQWHQARLACGRYEADPRNPFVYVPTRRDVETLGDWLAKLRHLEPALAAEPLVVVGAGYWPLPWYLRDFQVGYWPHAPEGLEQRPVVLVMPDEAAAVAERLGQSHVAVSRSLRSDWPVMIHVQRALWERWIQSKEP